MTTSSKFFTLSAGRFSNDYCWNKDFLDGGKASYKPGSGRGKSEPNPQVENGENAIFDVQELTSLVFALGEYDSRRNFYSLHAKEHLD